MVESITSIWYKGHQIRFLCQEERVGHTNSESEQGPNFTSTAAVVGNYL